MVYRLSQTSSWYSNLGVAIGQPWTRYEYSGFKGKKRFFQFLETEKRRGFVTPISYCRNGRKWFKFAGNVRVGPPISIHQNHQIRNFEKIAHAQEKVTERYSSTRTCPIFSVVMGVTRPCHMGLLCWQMYYSRTTLIITDKDSNQDEVI